MNNKTILSRKAALAAIVAMAAGGCALVVLVPETRGPSTILNAALFGAVFGTLFGQVALAAAWCALGPFALSTRLPMAAGWVAALVLALGCLIARDAPSGGRLVVLLIFGAALTGQWMIVQVPLWLLVAASGARMDHQDDIALGTDGRNQQFGIGQLMILTLIVGVALGGGRFLVGSMSQPDATTVDLSGIVGIFVIAVFQAVMALPLIAASFVRANVAIAVFGALCLVAVATWLEEPVLAVIEGRGATGRGSEYWMLWFASGIQASWVLAVVLVLRAGGYQLVTGASGKSAG